MRIYFKLIFVAALVFSVTCFSKEVGAVTVFSPVIDISVAPGESARGVVKVFNETDQAIFLESSIEVLPDIKSSPVVLPEEDATKHLSWFSLDQAEITLQPNQAVIIPFTVSPSRDAVSGGYYAVIFWKTQEGPKSQNAVGIGSKVGTTVLLTVTGDVIESGLVKSFSQSPSGFVTSFPVTFTAQFENTGNIHLRPSGEITLKRAWGKPKTLKFNEAEKTVLPGTSRQFDTVWGQFSDQSYLQEVLDKLFFELTNLPIGPHTATLNVIYGSALVQEEFTLNFWFFPTHLFIAIGSCILLLLAAVKINKKINRLKRQANKKNVDEAPKI